MEIREIRSPLYNLLTFPVVGAATLLALRRSRSRGPLSRDPRRESGRNLSAKKKKKKRKETASCFSLRECISRTCITPCALQRMRTRGIFSWCKCVRVHVCVCARVVCVCECVREDEGSVFSQPYNSLTSETRRETIFSFGTHIGRYS